MGKKGKKAKEARRFFSKGKRKGSDMMWDHWMGRGRGGGDDSSLPVVTRGGVREIAPAPLPPPDPALTRAIFEATTEIRLFSGDDDLLRLTKPRTLFITGKGMVTVMDTPLATFVGKPDGKPFIDGTAVPTEGVSLKVAKVKWEEFLSVVTFFRKVMVEKRNAEALIQFYWNPSTMELSPFVPDQRVSGGSVRYEGVHDPDGTLLHLLDIHSHNSMSAFWSGTDDADESRFEGRFFGVIGNLDKPLPSMKWRARVGGAFLELNLDDLVEMPPPMDVVVSVDHAKVWRNLATDKTTAGEVKMSFAYDPFAGVTFPVEWMDMVGTFSAPSQHGRGKMREIITYDALGNKITSYVPKGQDEEDPHGLPFTPVVPDSHEIIVAGSYVKLPGMGWLHMDEAEAMGVWPIPSQNVNGKNTFSTSMESLQRNMPSSPPTGSGIDPSDPEVNVKADGSIGSKSSWLYLPRTEEVFNRHVGLPEGIPDLMRCSKEFTITHVKNAFPQGTIDTVFYINPSRIIKGMVVKPRVKRSDGNGNNPQEKKEDSRGNVETGGSGA